MKYQIKWAEAVDRPAIDVISQVFEDNEYPYDEVFLSEALASKHILLACYEGRPAGYLVYSFPWGNTPFVALLRVMEPFQRSGLGTQLLSQLEFRLRKEGFNRLTSSSEAEDEGAQIFHKKCGFVQIGILKMGFGDEVFFEKALFPFKKS